LKSIADSSVFSGENWLSVDSGDAAYNGTKTMIASFSRSGGTVSIGTISIDIDGVKLFDSDDQSGILDTEDTTANGGVDYSVFNLDISTLTDVDDDLADLEQMIGFVDEAIGTMTTAASNLGAIKQRTKLQGDFVSALMTAIDQGVGALVDADMNEESTKLQALQVQQQLGIQALSIANQNSQMVLSLFR
jgi:flagellin